MNKKIKKVIWKICNCIPKRNIILFESHSDFCDSSKSLYEYAVEHKVNDKYKIIWVVDNPNDFTYIKEKNVKFVSRGKDSIIKKFKLYCYYAVAKYCFYTHNFMGIPENNKQIRYYLTHAAIPIKDSSGFYSNSSFHTYIECTSEFAAKYRLKAIGGGDERKKILGLPRNDDLFKNDNSKEKLGVSKFNKLIIWLPTFKHQKNGIRNDFNASISEDISMLNQESLYKINNFLKDNNSIMIIKFHPAQDMTYVKQFEFSNILFLTNKNLQDKKITLYKLLGEADALITDFSSVYIDYLLLDKPIGFELSDKEKYEKGIGFMLEKPLEYMPGNKIYNEHDFLEFINDVCDGNDKYKEERDHVKHLAHKFCDGNSCERIFRELKII